MNSPRSVSKTVMPFFSSACVRSNFLGDHGFGFHHGANIVAGGESSDVLAGILGSFGPEDVTTALFYASLELEQIFIEVIDGFPFNFVAALPRGFPIRENEGRTRSTAAS